MGDCGGIRVRCAAHITNPNPEVGGQDPEAVILKVRSFQNTKARGSSLQRYTLACRRCCCPSFHLAFYSLNLLSKQWKPCPFDVDNRNLMFSLAELWRHAATGRAVPTCLWRRRCKRETSRSWRTERWKLWGWTYLRIWTGFGASLTENTETNVMWLNTHTQHCGAHKLHSVHTHTHSSVKINIDLRQLH